MITIPAKFQVYEYNGSYTWQVDIQSPNNYGVSVDFPVGTGTTDYIDLVFTFDTEQLLDSTDVYLTVFDTDTAKKTIPVVLDVPRFSITNMFLRRIQDDIFEVTPVFSDPTYIVNSVFTSGSAVEILPNINQFKGRLRLQEGVVFITVTSTNSFGIVRTFTREFRLCESVLSSTSSSFYATIGEKNLRTFTLQTTSSCEDDVYTFLDSPDITSLGGANFEISLSPSGTPINFVRTLLVTSNGISKTYDYTFNVTYFTNASFTLEDDSMRILYPPFVGATITEELKLLSANPLHANTPITITQQSINGTVSYSSGYFTYTVSNASATTDSFKFTAKDNKNNVSQVFTMFVDLTVIGSPVIDTTSLIVETKAGVNNFIDFDEYITGTYTAVELQPILFNGLNATRISNSTIQYNAANNLTATDPYFLVRAFITINGVNFYSANKKVTVKSTYFKFEPNTPVIVSGSQTKDLLQYANSNSRTIQPYIVNPSAQFTADGGTVNGTEVTFPAPSIDTNYSFEVKANAGVGVHEYTDELVFKVLASTIPLGNEANIAINNQYNWFSFVDINKVNLPYTLSSLAVPSGISNPTKDFYMVANHGLNPNSDPRTVYINASGLGASTVLYAVYYTGINASSLVYKEHKLIPSNGVVGFDFTLNTQHLTFFRFILVGAFTGGQLTIAFSDQQII